MSNDLFENKLRKLSIHHATGFPNSTPAQENRILDLVDVLRDDCSENIADALTGEYIEFGEYVLGNILDDLQREYNSNVALREKVMQHWGEDYDSKFIEILIDTLVFNTPYDESAFSAFEANVRLFDAYFDRSDLIEKHFEVFEDRDFLGRETEKTIAYSQIMVKAKEYGEPEVFVNWFHSGKQYHARAESLTDHPDLVTNGLLEVVKWSEKHGQEEKIREALNLMYDSDLGLIDYNHNSKELENRNSKYAINAVIETLEKYKEDANLGEITSQIHEVIEQWNDEPNLTRRTADMYSNTYGNEHFGEILQVMHKAVYMSDMTSDVLINMANSINRLRDDPRLLDYIEDVNTELDAHKGSPGAVHRRVAYK